MTETHILWLIFGGSGVFFVVVGTLIWIRGRSEEDEAQDTARDDLQDYP